MKTRDVLRFLFASKYAAWPFALLVVQQVIVASSTVWLARFAAAAVSGGAFAGYGALYGVSLVLPYLPGMLALACVNLWDLDLNKRLVDRFVDKNQGQIALWRNHGARAVRTSLLSKEGPQALQESANYFFDLFSTGLNISMNAAVISFVIHPIFAASYAVGFALCALLIWRSQKRNETLAVQAQDSSVLFTGVMFRIWDNVLLANNLNLREWRGNADAAFEGARRDRLKSVAFTQIMSGVTTVFAVLPVAAAVIWFLTVHPSRSPETAALLITLPRLFMILTVTFHLLSLSFGWVAHIAKVKAVFDGAEDRSSAAADLRSQIDLDRITVESGTNPAGPANLEALQELLNRPGRHTIRGQNGAGKSALLLKLKEANVSRATYIPASHDLDVRGLGRDQSTGQRAKGALTEIFRQDSSPVMLLDEWDANLDALNRELLSEAIQHESLKRCIVEVVHSR
jgi:ABC-type multidrug transport system fused ATPase/permease subunit